MGKITTANKNGKLKDNSGITEDISQKEVMDVVKKLGLKKYRGLDVGTVEKATKGNPLQNKKVAGKVVKDSTQNRNKVSIVDKKSQKKKIKRNKKVTDDSGVAEPQTLIVKPKGKWFHLLEPASDTSEDLKPIPLEEVGGFRKKALQLLEKDSQVFKSVCLEGPERTDFLWTEKIIKSGTLPDRMAGFTIKIQDSPVHNLLCIQQLISMAKVQGKQQCLIAADTIKDLFLEDLLPTDRKLFSFESRGSKLRTASKKQLIVWVFEDRIKSLYKQYIESVGRMASDTVEKLRGKAISIIQQLLAAHPEQENVLLEMLVNKLGDPIKKVGSRALFHLTKLVEEHPRMKIVVIQEVERLLFRNNISVKAQYYGICFLNSIRLENEHPQVSSKLITVYLAFFKGCIKTGDIDSKMMSGLLTGVNKAYPTAKQYGFQFRESLDTLFKIVQLSQFNICVHALCILYQLIDVNKDQAATDRFYRVLYRTLLNSEFVTTAHNMQFLNLVFKSIKKDTVLNRVIAFTKRLLQICQNVQPNLACAILFLISEVSKTHGRNLVVGNVDVKESDAEMPASLSNLSDEESDSESLEISKRKQKQNFDIENLVKSSNIQVCDTEDDTDAQKTPDLNDNNLNGPQHNPIESKPEDLDEPVEVKDEKEDRIRTAYDPTARNPAFCGAELCIAYELAALTHHYHPTVALYANTLVRREKISYDGNPLKDFTIARFLDRFVYRNAKVKKSRAEYQPKGLRSMAVNSASYLQVDEEKVPEEEKFFYKYFKEKRSVQKDTKEDDSDVESVDDDEFDEFMGNYFKSGTKMSDSEEEDNVDFAAEVQTAKKKGPKSSSKERDSESEEDELDENDDEDDDNDDFLDLDDDDENDDFVDLDGDEDSNNDAMESDADIDDENEDIDFDSTNLDSEDDMEALDEHFKQPNKRLKRNKEQDMFAPADQFADLLEENSEEVLSGAQTLINSDRADKKQIKWEMERDRWMKGYKRSSKQHQRSKIPNKKRRKM